MGLDQRHQLFSLKSQQEQAADSNFQWVLNVLLPGLMTMLSYQLLIHFMMLLYSGGTSGKAPQRKQPTCPKSIKLQEEATLIYTTVIPQSVSNQKIIEQLSESANVRQKWLGNGYQITKSITAKAKSKECYQIQMTFETSNVGGLNSQIKIMQKFLYFLTDGNLIIIEQLKLSDQFDFKHHKLWILEPSRRLILYQVLGGKLTDMLSPRHHILNTAQELSAFKNHLQASNTVSSNYTITGSFQKIRESVMKKIDEQKTEIKKEEQNHNVPKLQGYEGAQTQPSPVFKKVEDQNQQMNQQINQEQEEEEEEEEEPQGFDTTNDFIKEDVVWKYEVVQDYEARIASYSEEKKQMYRSLISRTLQLKEIVANKEGWELIADDKKAQVIVECKKMKSGFMSVRARAPIDFAPIDVWRTLMYHQIRPEWDVNQEEIYWESKLGVNAFRMYNRTRRIGFVSGRDFLSHALTHVDTDGTIYASAVEALHDPEFEERMPPRKGVVRAKLVLTGWIIKPNPTDSNKCELWVYSEVDLNGSIPDFVLKIAFKDQGYLVVKVREQTAKFKEIHKERYAQEQKLMRLELQ